MEVIRRYNISRVSGERHYENDEEKQRNQYNRYNIMHSFQRIDTLLDALTLAQNEGESGSYQIPNGAKVCITKVIYREPGKEATRELAWAEFEKQGRPLTLIERIVETQVANTLK